MLRQEQASASHRELRPRKVKDLALLLGFNRHVSTDIARTEELSKKWDVFTVSRSEEPGREDHLHAFFNDLGKGKKSMILKTLREKVLQHTNVDVFLDYWWPANGYFADAYGLQWLDKWVTALLEAGAREVVLPYNKEVQEMEEKPNALAGEHIPKEQSALWQATHKTAGISWVFHRKKMLGLHKSTPFLRFAQGDLSYIHVHYTCYDTHTYTHTYTHTHTQNQKAKYMSFSDFRKWKIVFPFPMPEMEKRISENRKWK
jgi:hypothetical protein